MSNDLPNDLPNDNVSSDGVVQDAPKAAVPQGIQDKSSGVAEGFPQPQQVESIASPTPETQKPPETVFPPQAQPDQGTPLTSSPVAQPQDQSAPVDHVVDKRSDAFKVSANLKTDQPLTADADKEEEEFIEHVKELHS